MTLSGTNEEETTPGRGAVHPPVVAATVYRGLLGDIVRAATDGPHTEADPVGVLVTLLAGVGVLLGRGPHLQIASTRHPLLVRPCCSASPAPGARARAPRPHGCSSA